MKTTTLLSLSLSVLLWSCGGEQVATSDPGDQSGRGPVVDAALEALILDADPGDAVGVVAAKQAGAVESVVVEGRIHDLTNGFAMLKLMDTAMEYCGEVDKDDKCRTPWDYCCDAKEERVAHSLLVEFRGDDGRPLATASMPEARHCDLVKVTGALTLDEYGNAVLVADGLFRVERPEMPDYVRWPE